MDHKLFTSQIKDLTILYIEDDSEIQKYIAEFLGRYTTHLYLSQSAEEGMELCQRVAPDIILLDINLPNKSGIDFARELRLHDRNTRIIISTAYTDKEFLLTAVELELTRYLVKPVTSVELVDAFGKAAAEYAELRPVTKVDLGEGFYYDRAENTVSNGENIVTLRRKEMQLLEFFIEHSHRILSYETLQYEVWEDTPMSKDAVRAQIRNLRKKTHFNIVRNINAIGYRLFIKGQ